MSAGDSIVMGARGLELARPLRTSGALVFARQPGPVLKDQHRSSARYALSNNRHSAPWMPTGVSSATTIDLADTHQHRGLVETVRGGRPAGVFRKSTRSGL